MTSEGEKKVLNKITPEEASRILNDVDCEPLIPGAYWYIINHSWWVRFLELKDNCDQEFIEHVPINNEFLVQKIGTNYKLKPKLVESLNFVFVPEKIFFELKNAFGIVLEERDIIKRKVIEGTLLEKKTFIEVYPLEVKIADFKHRDVIIKLEITQLETIDDICSKALAALNIPKTGNKNIRFFVEDNGIYQIISTNINKIALNSILLSGSVIYIDCSDSLTTSKILTEQQRINELNVNRQNDDYSMPKALGLCGLQNLGNTCFMNSALQCLSNVPELTQYFLKGIYINEINVDNVLGTRGQLARAYGALIQEMWSGSSPYIKPIRLKSVIGEFAPRFNGYTQQDSQELTSFLLDGLHEDLNRIKKKPYIEEKEDKTIPHEVMAIQAWNDYKKRNDSIIVDLMHGQLKSTVVCPVCKEVSVKFDPFCFLSVPVPAKERQTSSIITLIRNDKWAKFAITHTNRATAAQAIALIKTNLQLEESTRIVLLTAYSLEILPEDTVLTPSIYSTSATIKNYYAFIVDSGPLIIIENKTTSYDRILGVPLIVNFPGDGKKLSRKLVLENIIPIVKERLFKTETSNNKELIDDNISDSENNSVQKLPIEEKIIKNNQLMPTDIIFYCDKKYISLPTNIEEEISIPNDSLMDFKLSLRWLNGDNFRNFDITRLVERELSMTLPLKKFYKLSECVSLFTSQEQLDLNDSWYCPKCKEHQRAFKKLDLWSLPKILIIHLKRFHYSRYSREKIDTEIIIPKSGLNLSNKVLNPEHKFQKYDLIAISNHMGGLGSGHYTALALNNGKWVEFNDSTVSVMKNSLPDTFASREAYILYYRRRETSDIKEVINSTVKLSPTKTTTTTTNDNNNLLSPNKSSLNVFENDVKSVSLNSCNLTTATNSTSDSTPSKRRVSETNTMEVDDN